MKKVGIFDDIHDKKILLKSFAKGFKEDIIPDIKPFVHEGISECIEKDTEALGTRVARVTKTITEKQYNQMVEGKTQLITGCTVFKETCEVVKNTSKAITDNDLKMMEHSIKIQKDAMDTLVMKDDRCVKQIKNALSDVKNILIHLQIAS